MFDAPEGSQAPRYDSSEREQTSSFDFTGRIISESISALSFSSQGTIQTPAVDAIVRSQATQIIGSLENMAEVAYAFFSGTYNRIPVLLKNRFYESLRSLIAEPRADFVLLCLCINLIQQSPPDTVTSMQSPLYTTIKNLVSFIETSNGPSLDTLHCRVLLIFYEIGHGLDMAAYISIAASGRIARALGFHRKPWRESNIASEVDKLDMEEKKRIWWSIINMDRITSLTSRDALFGTEDPKSFDSLPFEDSLWSDNVVSGTAPILATPSDIRVGQMARECQVSNLAGRVVRHISDLEPLDLEFYVDEAVQLERTLVAFIPLLVEEELKIGNYCGALGICTRYDNNQLILINCLIDAVRSSLYTNLY
jgi:hypothetical protein